MLRIPLLSNKKKIEPLKDRFASLSIGNTLTLKISGFLVEQQARILDVEEGHLRLQIGYSRVQRLLHRSATGRPLEIRFTFKEMDESTPAINLDWHPEGRYTLVDVVIHPIGSEWTADTFRQAARRLRWNLRAHFVAG